MTGALGQQPPVAGPTGAGADPGDGGDGHVPDLRQLTPGGVPHDALPIDASQLTQGVDVQGVGRPGRPAAVGRIGVGGQEPARVPGELSPAGPVPTPAKDLARSGPSPLISGHQRPLSAVVAPGCRG